MWNDKSFKQLYSYDIGTQTEHGCIILYIATPCVPYFPENNTHFAHV